MRAILLLLLLFLMVIVANAQSGRRNIPTPPKEPPTQLPVDSQQVRAPQPTTPLPPRELKSLPESLLDRPLESLDKGSFRFADFSGKVVVINIWASWCGPCRMEIPDYEKVRREFSGKPVEFVGLTIEDPRTSTERVKKFVRDFNFRFRLGWADRETAQTLMNGRGAIPQTLVIAPDGRIVSHWTGYGQGQSRRLRDTIKTALSEESSRSQQLH